MSLPVDSIDAVFRLWDTPDSPGCALGIVHAGALAYTRGYGLANLEYGIPITPASVFHVASVSKQFTATAIALLDREGKLSLDDDVRRYLPELPTYSAPITLRHLILHTSGLRDQWDLLYLAGWREADLKTNADVLALARAQREVNFQPGTAWAYSNTGYTLLALVVERVTGQSLRAYADAALFQPLGMTATHFHDNHREVVRDRAYAYAPKGDRFEISIPNFDTVGATSLFTTVEDLARWATNFFEPRIADRDFIAQLTTPGALATGQRLNYAFGLGLGDFHGLRMVGHSGGDAGYRARITSFPQQQLAVIVLCNLSTMDPERLALQVATLCLGESVRYADWDARATVLPSPEELAALAGVYRNDETGELWRLSTASGKLFLAGEPPIELLPLSSGRFRLDTQPYEVEFGAPAVDGTRELRVFSLYGFSSGAASMRYVSIIPFDPTPAELAAYEGTYTSEELGVMFTVALEGERLVLQRPKQAEGQLQATCVDTFSVDEDRFSLSFERDSTGSVTGFAICSDRVRSLQFTRARRSEA
jgi:CubicO group peptidase (beta-lactamase class C family)